MITKMGTCPADRYPADLFGLSTDHKPTDVPNASVFYEMDTKKVYMYDAEHSVWYEQ